MSARDQDRHFDVIVRFRVKVAADAGAVGVRPPGVTVNVRRVEFIDGAGDDQSVVADETDVVACDVLAVAEIVVTSPDVRCFNCTASRPASAYRHPDDAAARPTCPLCGYTGEVDKGEYRVDEWVARFPWYTEEE